MCRHGARPGRDSLRGGAGALERSELRRRWSPCQDGCERGREHGDERARGGVEEELVAGGDDDEQHERRVNRSDRADKQASTWRSRLATTISA